MAPFAIFSDPVDVARSYAAFDQAWGQIASHRAFDDIEVERERLARIVARYAPLAANEHDHVRRAVTAFLATA